MPRAVRRGELDQRLANLHLVARLDEQRRRSAVERGGHTLGVVFVEGHAAGEADRRSGVGLLQDFRLDELELVRIDLDGVAGDVATRRRG